MLTVVKVDLIFLTNFRDKFLGNFFNYSINVISVLLTVENFIYLFF